MAWHDIEGHDAVAEKLRRAVARNRLASSFLFAGPAGIGKRTFALRFAQALLCQNRPRRCSIRATRVRAAMALAGSHPDIEVIAKPEDKSDLPVALFLGDKEHRGREGLCHWIGLKPFMGGRRIAIIDDADFFNDAGANCLLKTLEEPPPRSVLILIGTEPRAATADDPLALPVGPLSAAGRTDCRSAAGGEEPGERSQRGRAAGAIQRRVDPAGSRVERRRVVEFPPRVAGLFVGRVVGQRGVGPEDRRLLDAAGKEAPARRARFRQVVGFAADFYRRMVFARERSAAEQFRRAPADADSREPLEMAAAQLSRRRDGRRRVPPALSRCASSRSTATPTSQR